MVGQVFIGVEDLRRADIDDLDAPIECSSPVDQPNHLKPLKIGCTHFLIKHIARIATPGAPTIRMSRPDVGRSFRRDRSPQACRYR